MNPIVQEVLSGLELAVENLIQARLDGIVEAQLEKLKALIPGMTDDMLISVITPQLKLAAKQGLLQLANQIDGKEG